MRKLIGKASERMKKIKRKLLETNLKGILCVKENLQIKQREKELRDDNEREQKMERKRKNFKRV